MVGNVVEWVADWGAPASASASWDSVGAGLGGDISHVGGLPPSSVYGLPGGTIRGGSYYPDSAGSHADAGVYAIDQNVTPFSYGD